MISALSLLPPTIASPPQLSGGGEGFALALTAIGAIAPVRQEFAAPGKASPAAADAAGADPLAWLVAADPEGAKSATAATVPSPIDVSVRTPVDPPTPPAKAELAPVPVRRFNAAPLVESVEIIDATASATRSAPLIPESPVGGLDRRSADEVVADQPASPLDVARPIGPVADGERPEPVAIAGRSVPVPATPDHPRHPDLEPASRFVIIGGGTPARAPADAPTPRNSAGRDDGTSQQAIDVTSLDPISPHPDADAIEEVPTCKVEEPDDGSAAPTEPAPPIPIVPAPPAPVPPPLPPAADSRRDPDRKPTGAAAPVTAPPAIAATRSVPSRVEAEQAPVPIGPDQPTPLVSSPVEKHSARHPSPRFSTALKANGRGEAVATETMLAGPSRPTPLAGLPSNHIGPPARSSAARLAVVPAKPAADTPIDARGPTAADGSPFRPLPLTTSGSLPDPTRSAGPPAPAAAPTLDRPGTSTVTPAAASSASPAAPPPSTDKSMIRDGSPAPEPVAAPPVQPAPPQPARALGSGPAAQVFAAELRRGARERAPAALPEAIPALGPTAPTTPASATTPAPAIDVRLERWPEAMVERIERLRDDLAAADTRVRLTPDALGPVEVSVRREGDAVHVHFAAEQAATRAIIQDAAPRLAEAAEARGLKLGQVAVGGGQADANGGRQQQAPSPAVPIIPPRARRDAAAAEDAADIRIA